MVTQTVCGPIRPAAVASANSRSANPPPLPSRAPSSPAATQPITTRSTGDRLGQRDPLGRPGRAADRGRLARRLAQPGRVEGEERLGFGQPGDGHVDGLAVLQRALPHRPLGGVRVGLHGAGRLPGRQGAQAFGGGLGPGEVRDAPGGAGEPGHLRRAHRGPHLLPQGRLGGQQVSRAAGVAVVPGRGTGHAAYPAARPVPQSGGPLVQPEADLQRDLEPAAAVVLDPAARVGDLEPVEVVQGLRGAADRAPDGVVDALGGGADDLADE